MLVAQLKDQQELNEANEVQGSCSIKELEGKLQAIDSAWRSRASLIFFNFLNSFLLTRILHFM